MEGSGAQQGLQLGEGHLGQVESGTVGRKEQQSRTCRFDRRPHAWPLVAAEVVHDDESPGMSSGTKTRSM